MYYVNTFRFLKKEGLLWTFLYVRSSLFGFYDFYNTEKPLRMPDDIAKAVVALCDGTLGFMTGESIILDGGMHIRKL